MVDPITAFGAIAAGVKQQVDHEYDKELSNS